MGKLMLRTAVVAGQFYSGNKERLQSDVEALMVAATPEPSIAMMSPHAGYVYSGAVAGKTFSHVKVPKEVIIIGPNHHGRGQPQMIVRRTWMNILSRCKFLSCNTRLPVCKLFRFASVACPWIRFWLLAMEWHASSPPVQH
jgi:hypothetical protein